MFFDAILLESLHASIRREMVHASNQCRTQSLERASVKLVQRFISEFDEKFQSHMETVRAKDDSLDEDESEED